MELQSFENATGVISNRVTRIGNQIFGKNPWKNKEHLVFISMHIARIVVIFIEPFMPYLAEHAKRFFNWKAEYWKMETVEELNLPCGAQMQKEVQTKYFLYENEKFK